MTIVRKLTDVTYEVSAALGPRSLRVHHVNGMKAWHSPVPSATVATECTTTLDPGPTIEEGTNLTTQQQNDLDNLVDEYQDVFSDTPGRTDVVEHVINTGYASPIHLAPYRTPHSAHEFLRSEIKTLLRQGIIVPSDCPWAAPVMLVPKADGSRCLCIDYRKLNLVTVSDPYPIPRIEDMIDNVGGSWWITAIDLTKVYWQIPWRRRVSLRPLSSLHGGNTSLRPCPLACWPPPRPFSGWWITYSQITPRLHQHTWTISLSRVTPRQIM